MQELDDIALLREYVTRDSEEAFAGIINRHVNKVYSVALRHTRNPLQAEEITEAVFVILAQKARSLSPRVILSGWLYQTARLASVTFIRSEIRRTRREQEAYMQTSANENEPGAWEQIAPLLDTAMTELNEADRHAIVLRYFDGKSMREVGGALGTSEDAAKKRVNRAVEKLQNFFLKRGIDSTAEAITGAISSNAVQTAPLALAKTVTAAAVAKGAAASGSTLTLIKGTLKTMTWLKMKFTAVASVGVLLAVSGATAIYETQKDADPRPSADGGPADMHIRWIVGKKYSLRVEMIQSSSTQVPNVPQPVKSDVNFTANFDVSPLKALDNGGQELELEFVSQTLNVLQGGVNIMSFDSAQSTDDQNPAKAVIGARVQFFTDATGKIEKTTGIDELTQRIRATGKSEAQGVFMSIFTEENLKRFLSFDDPLPNRTIAVGESWQIKKDLAGYEFGHLDVNVKDTFKNWVQHGDHKCAHIELAGDFATKTPSAASGALIDIKKGKISGDIWFDPALGTIVDSSSAQVMTVKVTTQGQTLTPQVSRKVRMVLLDVQ